MKHANGELNTCVLRALCSAQMRIRDLQNNERTKVAHWTRIIREELAKAGRAQNYHAYPDRTESFNRSEWLYDACWIDYGVSPSKIPPPQVRYLRSVAMAAECEWLSSDGNFLDDFEKLIQVRAKLRVMIFGGKHEEILDQRCAFASDVIERYADSVPEDVFLMVWMPDDSSQNLQFKTIEQKSK
jgi:hypothetical protein